MLILSLNIIAGWTLIGWLGALIWALMGESSPTSLNKPEKGTYPRDNLRQLTLFCGHCGVQPGPDDIYCPRCGFEII